MKYICRVGTFMHMKTLGDKWKKPVVIFIHKIHNILDINNLKDNFFPPTVYSKCTHERRLPLCRLFQQILKEDPSWLDLGHIPISAPHCGQVPGPLCHESIPIPKPCRIKIGKVVP